MNHKEELKKIVEDLKEQAKKQHKRLNNEQIAQAMGLERSYFSTLLGERGNVTQEHINLLRSKQHLLLSDTTAMDENYKDKYIALLEKQLADKEGVERELQNLRDLILTSRSKYDRTLRDVHAYLQIIYQRSIIHFSRMEQVDLEAVANDMDTKLAVLLDVD